MVIVAIANPPAPPPRRDEGSPLDETHFAQIRRAMKGHAAIRRACRTAHASGLITLLIGGSALVFLPLWWSWVNLLTGAAISAVGVVELVGAKRMRRLMPSAPRLLGTNQLVLLAVISLYCLAQMLTFSAEGIKGAMISPEVQAKLTELPSMYQGIMGPIERWAPILVYGFYCLVILLSAGCQGGMALYYFSRRGRVESFLRDNPPWISRLLAELSE